MRISYKGDYALKAILELSLRYGHGEAVPINEIASSGDMPEKFLEQILLALKNGGFVKSKRGVNGGFYLAKSPKDITVGGVIRFIEGPTALISCVEDGYKGCRDLKNCIFRDVWKEVGRAISLVIDTLTFEDLAIRYKERSFNMKPMHEYSI
ncbi:MAG: Rrf2 family transcriptional regulator [Candidatus Omnitrophota bacterium]|nr:Rrf2 family transcriptional regulator [Candidatus Omnitrophota bacterium]